MRPWREVLEQARNAYLLELITKYPKRVQAARVAGMSEWNLNKLLRRMEHPYTQHYLHRRMRTAMLVRKDS